MPIASIGADPRTGIAEAANGFLKRQGYNFVVFLEQGFSVCKVRLDNYA